MTPINSLHSGNLNRVSRVFFNLLETQIAHIAVQNPVTISRTSEPQPDIAILKPRPDFYVNSHPVADEVFLLIEVSVSTLRIDRKIKLPMYASAGVPEYWIVNVEEAIIEVYRNPVGNKYKLKEICENDDVIRLKPFDKEIKASDLLLL